MTTTTGDRQAIDTHAETIPLDAKEASPLARAEQASIEKIDFDFLRNAGFITPVADPVKIRAAFAYLQRVYASVLDENDFLYTVSYSERDKTREKTLPTLAAAKEWAAKYSSNVKASPKKSGITKLAMAFGIEAKRVKTKGLPEMPDAHYSCVLYEATHKQTGRVAEGIGWSDMSEHNGYMTRHNCVSTADTRGFNRSILRLLGFGEVSAEEIIASDNGEIPDVEIPDDANEPPKEPANLPAITNPDVMEAVNAWAEAAAARPMQERYLPKARQNDSEARDMRGQARIGDTEAAQKLGAAGYEWTGHAQLGDKSFFVAPSPVDPRSVRKPAAAEPKAADPAPQQQRAAEPADTAPVGDIPPPSSGGAAHQTELTNAQLIDLSKKLMAMHKDVKEDAQKWLLATVGVDSVKKLTLETYGKAMNALNAAKEAK